MTDREPLERLLAERVREVGGHAMITTRVELSEGPKRDDGGHLIGSVTSTLVVRGEDA